MVVTRKKLRSFKFTSIAQRWQDKADTLQKSSSLKQVTKTKRGLITKFIKKEHQLKIGDKVDKVTKVTSKEVLKTKTKDSEEDSPIIKKTAKKPLNKKTEYSKRTTNKIFKRYQKEGRGITKEPSKEALNIEETDKKKRSISEKTEDTQSLSRISEPTTDTETPPAEMEPLNFSCTECEFTTTNQSHFTKHIKRQILTCSQCDFETDLKCVLHAHKFTCQLTKPKIKPNYDKNLEIIAQKGPVYFCDFCPFICKERFEIVEHVKKDHKLSSSTDLYFCSCCDFETKMRSNLRLHYVHVHQMLSENVKYIADRSFKNENISKATDSQNDRKEVKSEHNSTKSQSANIDPMKRMIQEKKAQYLKTHLKSAVMKNGSAINREGKENKKKQYIQSQLQSLQEKDQKEIQKKLTNRSGTADCQSETTEGSEKSYSGQSDKSDGSEIAEIIKVFFQDKAIEISLKRSTPQNPSMAKRKCVEVES